LELYFEDEDSITPLLTNQKLITFLEVGNWKHQLYLVVIIPDHKELAVGTFHAILRQADMSLEDFMQKCNQWKTKKKIRFQKSFSFFSGMSLFWNFKRRKTKGKSGKFRIIVREKPWDYQK
jgi:hypothetical protein